MLYSYQDLQNKVSDEDPRVLKKIVRKGYRYICRVKLRQLLYSHTAPSSKCLSHLSSFKRFLSWHNQFRGSYFPDVYVGKVGIALTEHKLSGTACFYEDRNPYPTYSVDGHIKAGEELVICSIGTRVIKVKKRRH